MSNVPAPQNGTGAAKKSASKIVLWQLLASCVSALIFLALYGSQHALAAFSGGLVAVIPSYYFVKIAFAKMFSVSPEWTFRAFFVAEGVKFLLTTLLFVVVVMVFKEHFVPSLVTYFVALLAYKAALIKEFKVIKNG